MTLTGSNDDGKLLSPRGNGKAPLIMVHGVITTLVPLKASASGPALHVLCLRCATVMRQDDLVRGRIANSKGVVEVEECPSCKHPSTIGMQDFLNRTKGALLDEMPVEEEEEDNDYADDDSIGH